VISVAAELTGLHPQTLRQYDRAGLVSPGRTGGGGRRYSLRDIELLREIAELTASGIGLEGVRRILELENQVTALRARNAELRGQVSELKTALEATLATLQERRPNLPALRPRGAIRPFEDLR
jgi:MerR family transcriptional regulator/heat shock protein HspR